jgi:hypothetical protein
MIQIMERCEELEQFMKVITSLLAFNVMKHSEEFVEGITNIKEINDDVGCIHSDTKR